jgi:hypothetical protein
MTTENQRLDFSKRFKPCKLVMFYAHGHRVNDYQITDREAEVLDDGTEVSRWKTTKTIPDPENAKKAASLRAKFIKDVCKLGVQYGQEKLVFIDFEKSDDLDLLKTQWAQTVQEFNAQSPIVKVRFGTLPALDLTGPNEYLLGNLVDEMKDTLGEMKQALENADYKGVREVVGRLKGFISLVPDNQATVIASAIQDARKQARSMKSMLLKKGKTIQDVQALISTSTVDLAVAACLGDDAFAVLDGPSASDLMEAHALEFCAAIQDDGQGVGDDGQDLEDDYQDGQAPLDTPEAQAVLVDQEAQGPEGPAYLDESIGTVDQEAEAPVVPLDRDEDDEDQGEAQATGSLAAAPQYTPRFWV